MTGIVLLGPPGAGKGTQAIRLAQELILPHISTGEILRQNVKDLTSLGEEAEDYMNRGLLVPDALVAKMLTERFDRPDVKKGFILDGYPRNISQAKTLDDILSSKKLDISTVFYLDTSDEVIIQRLSGRLVCKVCGLNFHIKNIPPKNKGMCDSCGGKLYQRKDDSEGTVKKRLEVYKKEAAALIEFYEAKQKLHRLSADGNSEDVLKQIVEVAQKCDDTLKI